MTKGDRDLLETIAGLVALGVIVWAMSWLFSGCSKHQDPVSYDPGYEIVRDSTGTATDIEWDWDSGCTEGCL